MKRSLSLLIPPGSSFGLVLVCALFVLGMNILVLNVIQDDGFISFHYADNLLRFGSLYYNPGEHGPYGYTNPLYILLLAFFRLISLRLVSYELISRLIASVSLFAILLFALRRVASLWNSDRLSALFITFSGLFLFLLYPSLLPNFFSGLETALFTLFTVYLLYAALFTRFSNEGLFLLCLGLALALRMDAVFVLLPILLYYLYFILEARDWHKLARLAAVLCLVGLLFLLQYLLSGSLLPLSFGHKRQAFSYINFFAYLAYSAIALFPILLVMHRRLGRRRLLFVLGYLLYTCLFYSFFLLWHFWRYVFPVVFALFAVLWIGLLASWQKSDRKALLFLLLYALFVYIPLTMQGYAWVSGYRVAWLIQEQIAQAFIAAHLPPEDRIFAGYDAGYIPYRTDWRIVDLQGLTTPEVTRQDIAGVIALRDPTVLIISTGEYEDQASVRLYSQYQAETHPVPPNYTFITRWSLPNNYWWTTGKYYYYIYVNQHANPALIDGLKHLSLDPEREMGFQKTVYRLLQYWSENWSWLRLLTAIR